MLIRKMGAALLLGALSIGAVAPVRAATDLGLTGNINGVLGRKTMNDKDWKPVEDQLLLGVQADFRRQTWPVSIAVDILQSLGSDDKDGVSEDGATTEFAAGVRKVFENDSRIAPFVGGGLSLVHASLKAERTTPSGNRVQADDNDSAIGLWVGGGVLFRVTQKLNLGLNLRYSHAEVNLFGNNIDAGGVSFGLLGGVRF